MTIHNSLSELIGNTPLVKLHHVTDGVKATIAVKVEYFNPGGSSKDRIAGSARKVAHFGSWPSMER